MLITILFLKANIPEKSVTLNSSHTIVFELLSKLPKIHEQQEIKKCLESSTGREADKIENGQGADKEKKNKHKMPRKYLLIFQFYRASQHLHPCHN